MPQLSQLVITDRRTPPVEHTFIPRDIVDGVGTLVASTGVPIADKRITISMKRTASGNYKGRVQLAIPVVEDAVINGITSPTVIRTSYVDMNFTFASTSTTAERESTIGLAMSCLSSTQALPTDTLVKLQGVY